MSAADMIARLDASLARCGQTVTVKKHDSAGTATVMAHVRPAKEDEIAGLVQQVWLKVILSPTGLSGVLPLRKGDKITVDGRDRQIEFPRTLKVADVLVRLEPLVAG
jgi:hypothetical protein